MRIFHISTAADWAAAQVSGTYTTSTRGRTLAEEGFIHASRADQWPGVRRRYYADVTEPLVLLVVDTERLEAPVVEEEVPGGETFPHVYGPIDVDAVVDALPLDRDGATAPAPISPTISSAPAAEPQPSFLRLYLREVAYRMALGLVVMLAFAGGLIAATGYDARLQAAAGLLAGLVALAVVGVVYRRRRATERSALSR